MPSYRGKDREILTRSGELTRWDACMMVNAAEKSHRGTLLPSMRSIQLKGEFSEELHGATTFVLDVTEVPLRLPTRGVGAFLNIKPFTGGISLEPPEYRLLMDLLVNGKRLSVDLDFDAPVYRRGLIVAATFDTEV